MPKISRKIAKNPIFLRKFSQILLISRFFAKGKTTAQTAYKPHERIDFGCPYPPFFT